LYRISTFIATILILFCVLTISAQHLPSASISESVPLKFAWAGGMNAMQFGAIDLNMDGYKDLVALDRDGVFNVISTNYEGNRIYCFLNNATDNEIDYSFAPQYISAFPQLYNWAVFTDYNFDGKIDIFTYSPGWAGMKVYKNISTTSLEFEVVADPFLTSFQGGGYTNILVTYSDYPGIYDLDGDGDLDILTFSPLGSFVDMHKNLSQETYGHADSLLFEKTESCWGHFAESDESNELFLDTCNNEKNRIEQIQKERHTGSTFLLIDLDADADADLLLSDIDYPGLYALTNDGTPEEAHIGSYDTLFPQESETARIFSMPVAAYIDVNNDGIKDLLVSTFDPSIYKSENKNSVWLYLNNGENNKPEFELFSKNFLQGEMLDFGSAAYPTICDFDGDGLEDIIVGNYGYYRYSYYDNAHFLHSFFRSRIDFYKNTGSIAEPRFQMWQENIGDFWKESLLGLAPAIGDLDGDGLKDILAGNSDGKLFLSKQTENGEFEIIDKDYFDIDVGDFSYPQLFDLDKDGESDLIIGEKNGNINYFHNEGTDENPNFIFVTDSLGKVNVTDYSLSYFGYSTPYFFRLSDGTTKLIVGSEQGLIHYFEDIDGNLDGKFTLSENLDKLLDTSNVSFDRGLRTAAAASYFGQNNSLKMTVGNYAGGLEFFNTSVDVLPGWNEKPSSESPIKIYPNPTTNFVFIESEKGNSIKQVKLYSAKGKLISVNTNSAFNQSNKTKLTLNIPNGIYFAEIKLEDKTFVEKVIVLK